MKNLSKLMGAISLLLLISCNENDDFPVSVWNKNSHKPIIFYLSGDGGFNTFSKTFAEELHKKGYDVFALNTKKYFWKKKTPFQTSKDTEKYLQSIIKSRKNKKIILIGYSYGADVSPFVYNRFNKNFQKNIQNLILIDPSQVNDFEIHLQEYITGKMEYGFSVLNEINDLQNAPFTLVVSDFDKKYFPKNKIKLKKYRYLHLQGNHHFDGNTKMLADSLVKYF